MKKPSAYLAFVTAVTSLFVVGWSTAATETKDTTAIRPFTVPIVSRSALDDAFLNF